MSKILVADDDVVVRQMLQAALGWWGYEVVLACDGLEAWQILSGPDPPTIAVVDWMMPGMDGVEICRRVRERAGEFVAGEPYTYLILLTSNDSKALVAQGLDAGADDYIIKPFEPSEFRARLRAAARIVELDSRLRLASQQQEQAQRQLADARRREGELGARIQRELLLGEPPQNMQGMKVAALSIASEAIDGDFYDFFRHNTHCMDVVVGDVMGHGVPAALFSAATKSYLSRAIGELGAHLDRGSIPDCAAIVSCVRDWIIDRLIRLEQFITLCYVRFDLAEHKVEMVDCGHTPTIHFQSSLNQCVLFQGDNMPLGSSDAETYRVVSGQYERGDVFILYSDGVIEAHSPQGEMFGIDRLLDVARANSTLPPEQIVERVRQEVVGFAQRDTFEDDLTCVAVQISA